jgi:hypothetical protein
MGNEGPSVAQENVIGEVESARLVAVDEETGEVVDVLTDEGIIKTVIETADGDRLTDALEDNADDELRVSLYATDDDGNLTEVQGEQLDQGISGTTFAQLTYMARALHSQGIDEFVTRVTDSTGTQIDPLSQDVTEGVSNDHVRTSLYGENPSGNLVRLQLDSNGEIEASLEAESITVDGDDDDGNTLAVNAETLSHSITDPGGLVTYPSRALQQYSMDELRARVHDSTGTQLDLLNQDPLESVADDELRSRLFGIGSGGVLQQVNVKQIGNAPSTNDAGVATYIARALNSLGEDELVSRIADASGTQVDPAVATDYLEFQTTGHDLVGAGDLTIGPGAVERGTAVTIAATSTDNNTFSVSVSWGDGSGNTFQSESAADIGLDTITEDYARLVRKGPRVSITVTDESGAAQNTVNIHADTER